MSLLLKLVRSNFDQALLISLIIISTLHQAVGLFVVAFFLDFLLLILCRLYSNLWLLHDFGVYFSFIFFFFRCHLYHNLSSIFHWIRLVHTLLFFNDELLLRFLFRIFFIFTQFCCLLLFLVIIECKSIILVADSIIRVRWLSALLALLTRLAIVAIFVFFFFFILIQIINRYSILWSIMLIFDNQNLLLRTLHLPF